MELPKSTIRKGSEVVGTNDSMWKGHRKFGYATPDLENIETPTVRLRKETKGMKNPFRKDKPVVENGNYEAPSEDLTEDEQTALEAKNLHQSGALSTEGAADRITGIIRRLYVNDLKDQGSSFGLEDLHYLDDIIFNQIREYIIAKFNNVSNPVIESNVITIIREQSALMDYHMDSKFYDAIRRVIKMVQ